MNAKRLAFGLIFVALSGLSGEAASPLPECRQRSEGFYECEYASAALGKTAQYTLQLPKGYDAARGNWPVVLFLHGAGRNAKTLWDSPGTREILAAARFVVIMPNGGNSWWIDSAQMGRYASFPMELLARLQQPLGLTRNPKRRAAAGWSMGGYGSIRLVETHPEIFGAWGGIIALLDFPNPAYPKSQNHSVPALFGDAAKWPSRNPISHVERLADKPLWFVTADQAFERSMNESFDARLRERRILHTFRVVPGSHRFDVVASQLPPLFEWLDSIFESERK